MGLKGALFRGAQRVAETLGLELSRSRVAASLSAQLRLAMQRHRVELVADVGANVGQFAQDLMRQGYSGHIVSFEPLPEAHAELTQAASRIDRWTVFERVALGACDDVVRMQVAGNSVSSSVLTMLDRHVEAAPDSAPVATVEVRQTTLDAALGSRVATASTLLKIDAQGYERQVLEGGSACVAQIPLVLLELTTIPLYEGQWLWLDALAFMNARGFELWALHPEFCDPKTGQVLQYNGLFSRG
jgi:FkbM family methyltransferase